MSNNQSRWTFGDSTHHYTYTTPNTRRNHVTDFEITQEGDSIRIKTDRAGERAVSAVLNRDEASAALTELAGLLGYTVSPSDSSEGSDDAA